MKRRLIWKILLIVGIAPLVFPLLFGLYRASTESATLSDWLILYSFLYWPTYLVGIVLVALSAYKLNRKQK